MNKLTRTTTLGAAILTAMLPLACCWGPTLLAGVAVLGGAATNLAWLHPYEPWIYAVSFTTLGYSHFKTYRASKNEAENCQSCASDEEAGLTSAKYAKIGLWVATGIVIIMFLTNQYLERFY